MSKIEVSAPYAERIAQVRAELARRKLDGYLILNRMDQIWLTGFSGEDGLALVTRRDVALLTDGRFAEAAERQAPYARKVLRKKRTAEFNAGIIRRFKLARLGFDPAQITLADHGELKKHLGSTKLVPLGGVLASGRQCKDATEIAALRRAIDVAQNAFRRFRDWLRPGHTEREAAARLEYEMKALGAQGPSFPTIMAFGANASLPHYESGDAVLGDNSAVLIDWGAQVGWYCSDLTRMLWIGKPSAQLREINNIVHEAHDRAIEAVRPGVTGHDVDRVARQVITKAGYGKQFGHATGHGLGIDVHEAPRVGMQSRTVLEPGMVITIEPGIYVPGVGGVRIEDDVLVTDHGHQVLTSLEIDRP